MRRSEYAVIARSFSILANMATCIESRYHAYPCFATKRPLLKMLKALGILWFGDVKWCWSSCQVLSMCSPMFSYVSLCVLQSYTIICHDLLSVSTQAVELPVAVVLPYATSIACRPADGLAWLSELYHACEWIMNAYMCKDKHVYT